MGEFPEESSQDILVHYISTYRREVVETPTATRAVVITFVLIKFCLEVL